MNSAEFWILDSDFLIPDGVDGTSIKKPISRIQKMQEEKWKLKNKP